MKTPQEIIDLILEDAPSVYDILNEEHRPWMYGNFPQSYSKWTWEDFYKENPDITPPTPEQLLEYLTEYSGDNYDTHYQAWHYAQILETSEHIDRLQSHLAFEMQSEWALSHPSEASAYRNAILLSIEFIQWKA